MKVSKSERPKKIVQTDDKRLFYTTVNNSSENPDTKKSNIRLDSLQFPSINHLQLLEKESSYEYKIGNYLVQQTLGEGTFGKVKLGIFLPNDEKVAIKVLEKDRMTDKDDHIRIKREFDMLSKFNHPNVILVTEIFESADSYYSVMEYCEKGELFNYIVKKKRLTEKESSFLYFQIINGLEYIHSLGIVHRDLKPENLLLTKDHLLKIIDFGLSNYFEENQTELLSTPCGSPCYASPEMVAGKKYDGIKIDIWATGIILFAMLCGYLPFEDKNNDILFDKILECKIEFPEFLSDESKDLISKILVIDPDKRITIPQIKNHSFFLKGKKLFEEVFTIKPMDEAPINNQENENEDNDDNNQIEDYEMYEEEDNNEEENNEENNTNENDDMKKKGNNENINESNLNNEIKKDNELNENKENINIENFKKNENNISINNNNNQINKKEKTNYKKNTTNNIKNNHKELIINNNYIKKIKRDKVEEVKNSNNKQKTHKNNKRIKELNNKYFSLFEKKINHKKVNITDNNINYSPNYKNYKKNNKNSREPNKRNKINKIPVHKTPKEEKNMKHKEKVNNDNNNNKNNLLLEALAKDRNTIGSIASVCSSIVETINNSQQTNLTNFMANNNINYSFEQSKRTYSHENTKDITQNEQTTKHNIKNTISNNNITKNNNINIIDNNDNNNFNEIKSYKKELNNKGYLLNQFNFHNKNIKIKKKNPNKIKKNLKDLKPTKYYHNSDYIQRPKEELDFNVCKLNNDSNIKKAYLLPRKYGENNNNSKSKNKDNPFYTKRTNQTNTPKINISNNKDNINNENNNKKNYIIKMQNSKNNNSKEISIRKKSFNKNKNFSSIKNNNSKQKYKKLMIKSSNILNKGNSNSKKKNNKIQYNNFLNNQNSLEAGINSINIQTEPNKIINKLIKNSKIKNEKINLNNENKKNNYNSKQNTQKKPFSIESPIKRAKIRQKLTKYNPINQVINTSNKKQFQTINNIVINFKIYKSDLNSFITTNKSIHKNIVKQKTSYSHRKKYDIPNKIIEKASKSIEINNYKNKLLKPDNNKINNIENNRNEILNNISKISTTNNISKNENVNNYIKMADRIKSKSKSKIKEKSKNKENKEEIKTNNETLIIISKHDSKNKILKMNKFRNICLNNNTGTIDVKENGFNIKKKHIRNIKIITNLNNKRDNLFKIQKNKTHNNLSNRMKHIISNSSQFQNNSSLLMKKIKHNKFNSMKLTDIYKNHIKNKNKLQKVYLIDISKKNRNNSNESKKKDIIKNKGIINNPAVFQRQIISIQNYESSKDTQHNKRKNIFSKYL